MLVSGINPFDDYGIEIAKRYLDDSIIADAQEIADSTEEDVQDSEMLLQVGRERLLVQQCRVVLNCLQRRRECSQEEFASRWSVIVDSTRRALRDWGG